MKSRLQSRYHGPIMPSWNIHTAHVERLLADYHPADLGIGDVNAFLFGNFVPDIYAGFMVPDATMRIDYCLSHLAMPNTIPLPDADRFWDTYIRRRQLDGSPDLSLLLGAWVHLVADRRYNGRFRQFCETHDTPTGEELRIRKQGDFDVFGRSLDISLTVEVTPELLDAAQCFRPYAIFPDDVRRSAAIANAIVQKAGVSRGEEYRLLGESWMQDVFEECHERLATWLSTWVELANQGECVTTAAIRKKSGLHDEWTQ